MKESAGMFFVGPQRFHPTPASGPIFPGGGDLYQYRDRQDSRYDWESGRYHYPDWVRIE